ncbi:MAG TPA: AAA family ATPase [Roseiflexaceae bacterium]|nr:AAA family ATPase [Roseiflexaceae bacterium]
MIFDDLLSDALGQLLGELFGETLTERLERRALARALDAAVTRAAQRFAESYSGQDAELTDALTKQTRFADLPSVRAAMRDLLTRPFHDPSAPVATLRRSFTDVLPDQLDRARVDAAVQTFLQLLGQEVLYIPQLRDLYALAFQKASAEHARTAADHSAALLDTMRELRSDMRLLTGAGQPLALPAPDQPTAPPRPRHNLPQRSYAQFIGRQTELRELERLMLPHPRSRHFVVTLDGIGGVGKSALALELAHGYRDRYAELPPAERFEAIVWVSAKRTLLTAGGIQQRRQTFSTLADLQRTIGAVLDEPAAAGADPAERHTLIEHALAAQRTLLIVDNLETVDDEELLTFLRDLPDPTKALITTRHRIDVAYAIRLTGMPEPDARALMQVEAEERGVALPEAAIAELYRRSGGVPLAIVWSIGLMSVGHSVETVLRRLGSGHSDIARFCFGEMLGHIRGRDAERLLLALALFERSVGREMLGVVAGLAEDPIGRDEGLAELVRLSLANQSGDRFKLLPLTHSFAQAQLAERPELERELRDRWIAHLTELAEPYQGPRWRRRDRQWLINEGQHLVDFADWCERTQRLDLLTGVIDAVVRFYDFKGRWTDALRIARVCAEHARLAGDLATAAALQVFPITWVLLLGEELHEEAEQAVTESIALARLIDDPVLLCEALVQRSRLLRKSRALDQALACCEEALREASRIDSAYQVYVTANLEYEMGRVARTQGNWERAKAHFDRVRQLFPAFDQDPVFMSEFSWNVLRQLAVLARDQGDDAAAVQLFREAVEIERALDTGAHLANPLVNIALLEERRGNLEAAREAAQEALMQSTLYGLRYEATQAEAVLKRLEGR